MRTFILAGALTVLGACGGPAGPAGTSAPSPSVTQASLDEWQKEVCQRLAKSETGAGDWLVADIYAQLAEASTDPAFVDLGLKTRQTQSTNLLRGWCVQNYPAAGVQTLGTDGRP